MSYATVTFDYPDGRHIVYKPTLGRTKLIDRSVRLLADEYSFEAGVDHLRALVGPTRANDFVSVVQTHTGLCGRLVQMIDDLVINQPDCFSSFRNRAFPRISHSIIEIPKQFNTIADLDADGVGKGEALVPLLFQENIEWLPPGNAHDFRVGNEFWHFKDHRNADSTPMGRPNGYEEFYETPIMLFIKSLGINVHMFGTTDFKDKRHIETALLKRYACNDLRHAAACFEAELHKTFQESACLRDSAGTLFLKKDDNGLFIHRIDKHDLYFHSNGGRGFKAGDTPNRFTHAIITRLIREECEARWAAERNEARLERERLRAEKKEKKRLNAIFLKASRDSLRAQNEEMKAREFMTALAQHGTMAKAARHLKISSSTATSRRRAAKRLKIENV